MAATGSHRVDVGLAYAVTATLVAVATVVARQGLDDISIAAALLHDAVEDTVVGLEELERDFSAELAGIVDGVTKLDRDTAMTWLRAHPKHPKEAP